MTTSRTRRSGRAAAMALALGVTLATTACGVDRPHAAGVTVIVVGNRANQPRPTLTDKAQQLIRESIESEDTVYVFDVSGKPTLQGTLDTSSECDSSAACSGPWSQFAGAVAGAVSNTKPSAPQADLLGALALAGRQFSSARGPKHLLVIDNGVQTTGDLPLGAPGALDVDPNTITASLKTNQSLPALSGVDVLVTGLGSAYAPQPALSAKSFDQLGALWKAVFLASGVDSNAYVEDTSPLPDTAPGDGLPAVTPVSFASVPRDPGGQTCDYRIRADQIGFEPNEATFLDDAQARSVLAPIAKRLIENNGSISLTGTTALPEENPNSPDRLSLRRAEAVRDVLLSLKVPARLITEVSGVGVNFPGFVKDTNSKGQVIETLAIQNRLVLIKTTACTT